MNNEIHHFDQLLASAIGQRQFHKTKVIQPLWAGYGEIAKYCLAVDPEPAFCRSGEQFIVKHINPKSATAHPQGWAGKNSHKRKLQSYQVEINFYKNWSQKLNLACVVPEYIADVVGDTDATKLIVMSDLDAEGYQVRKQTLTIEQSVLCLHWLANFHAGFIVDSPAESWANDLWPVGSYWHLATRQDEFNAMQDSKLKSMAQKIDHTLNQSRFKTILHGDAKVANFCFSDDLRHVAAVDFQYAGKGCGIKDVIYFLGSCLDEQTLSLNYPELLNQYFKQLAASTREYSAQVDIDSLQTEWRQLAPFAWADFERFLLGWSPSHKKLTRFSRRQTNKALVKL